MDGAELRRLIVRHRHVAPMLSVLLAGTDARLTITDTDGAMVLDRQVGGAAPDAPRFIGWRWVIMGIVRALLGTTVW